jgi:hypothetical protein
MRKLRVQLALVLTGTFSMRWYAFSWCSCVDVAA